MNLLPIAGIIIIVGFVLYIIAMFVAPRLYQESDLNKRVEIIAANRTRWIVSQIFFALGALVPSFGFVLFALHLNDSQNPWLMVLGVAAFVVGAIFGVIFIYRQTQDPLQFWESAQPSTLIVGYIVLTSAALFLYGFVFLQADFPAWLGYLSIAAPLIFVVVFVITRGTTVFALSVLAYIVTLIAGIVMVRG